MGGVTVHVRYVPGLQGKRDRAFASGAHLRRQHGGEAHGLPHVCGSGGRKEGESVT